MNLIPIGSGKCSNFGGPRDTGVGETEGLGLIEMTDLSEWWFRRIFLFPGQWENSKGLARNLNPDAMYCALRFGYGSFGVQGEILPGFSRDAVRRALFIVEFNGKHLFAQGADWGPNDDTGRLIDLSPGACRALGVQTDDCVLVTALI